MMHILCCGLLSRLNLVAALPLDVRVESRSCHSVSLVVWSFLLLFMRLDMLWGSGMSTADLTEMIMSMCTQVRVMPFLYSIHSRSSA